MSPDRWSNWWRTRRAGIGAFGGIALFFALFFARVFIRHRFIITGDAFYYTYPLRTVAWNMIRTGTAPLWTPLLLSGYPLISVPLLAVGYPVTWGHAFLPGHWAEQIYALAPFLLSPLTTYAYAREIGRSRLAALLAGFSFGYGGMMCGILANSGMLTNGFVWCPLVLLFIDRARRRSTTHCLLWATVAYSMSVLAGHAQSYVYTGTLALAYGLFTSLELALNNRRAGDSARNDRSAWRPLIVAIGALVLAGGVAAFQLLETVRVARLSVRRALSYEVFSEGSFTLREAILSLGAQLYHYIDTGTYVTPLALILAVVAVGFALRGHINDARIWFWSGVAVVAFLMLMGSNTPLNRLLYHLPVMNMFRVPSRHTFEWTLAISILAAFGWDAAAAQLKRNRERVNKLEPILVFILLAVTATVGVLWWRAIVQWPEPHPTIYTALPEKSYWLWKLAFTSLIFLLAWRGFKLTTTRLRNVALIGVIVLACFVEANATVTCWWAGFVSLPAERFQVVSDVTRHLKELPPDQNRIYTRVGMFSEEFTTSPRLEAPNLTMLYGLHNVAGMEPLILSRYSRALGNVGPDSVTPIAGAPPTDNLFSSRSRVLDLLNTTHVVSYSGTLGLYEEVHGFHDGVGLSLRDFSDVNLAPGATVDLRGPKPSGDTLALVTSLSNSVSETQDSPVAKVRIHTSDGRVIEQQLRAGIDTAEWAHERPDVKAAIQHKLAQIYDSRTGDAANSYAAHRYWARLWLDKEVQLERVEVTNVSRTATLTVWKASLFNSRDSRSFPLAPARRSEFWQTVYEQNQVEIIRNARALPRVWLVAEAEGVDSEEALRRIRGEGAREFDPRRTALLEMRADELPALPGGQLANNSNARIVSYEPNRIMIDTEAETSTVLVVSEIFYPGWEAKVDGAVTQINPTDYLLRGVVLPAGRHRVEMRFIAPGARKGALLSLLTVAFLGGLWIRTRRKI